MAEFGHIGFAVKDLDKSKAFYTQALAPLGIQFMRESDTSAHFGSGDGTTMLWIHTRGQVPGPFHIAFEAESKEDVDAFYKAALAAGGTDNGAPGIREHYSPTYYAAFVFDPNGNNLEAVCRG
jgi:catechol 2,3-dioxygenase-like lactoylglutathione lyase family enzyme